MNERAEPNEAQTKFGCTARIPSDLMPALQGRKAAPPPMRDKWRLRPAPKDMDADEQTLLFEYPPCQRNPAGRQ